MFLAIYYLGRSALRHIYLNKKNYSSLRFIFQQNKSISFIQPKNLYH